MEADIMPMQCEVLNVFNETKWDKNSYKLFQLRVCKDNLFATSKWNGHVTVHKNCSSKIVLILTVAIYHMHGGMNLLIVHEKRMTENLTHLLVK